MQMGVEVLSAGRVVVRSASCDDYSEKSQLRMTEESTMSSPQAKAELREQQLGCYRFWVRPKALDKKSKKRSHSSILGHYLIGEKR